MHNDIRQRQIRAISEDIKQQPTDHLSARYLALQLDESTDVANGAILLAYVKRVWNAEIPEQYLFGVDMVTSSTAVDLFSALDNYRQD